ncbi:MAG TPA: PEGA domain-containing protein [Polyangiaceae bacterium]|nr:PEGA domain-containing protein [Polyangiaceae bacterium]
MTWSVLRSSRSLGALASLAWALLVVCPPSPACAQPAPGKGASTSDAAVLKKQGDDAMLTLRYQDALTFYEQAYQLSKDPALHYNRGRALEALGRYPDALHMLEAFMKEASPELRARVPKLDELVAQIQSRVARLSVKVDAKDASVQLGAENIGDAPLVDKEVNAGKARLEITAEGYEPLVLQVDLKGGKATELDLKLVPRDKQGTLVVRASVPGADVEVDGKNVGQAPAEVRLDPGTHEIGVEHGGYESEARNVVIGTGEKKVVEITLREAPAAWETWWFWTLIGGGVAAGTAVGVTYALTTEKSPGVGTIDPGQIPIDPAGAHLRLRAEGVTFVLPFD